MKRFKLTPLTALLGVVAIIAAGAFFLAPKASKDADVNKSAAVRPALTVTTVRPSQAQLPIKLAANGNIMAWQEASIGSEANGLRLAEVRVDVGDQVQAGQVLASFAGESVQAEVAQARANLMETQASAADAAANAARARSLQASGAISAQQVSQYLTAEQMAQAKVEAAKAMLAAQQLRLKHVHVVAPDNGIISARTATIGAVVPAGTELFRMIRKGRLEWRAEVTASELGRIKADTPVTVMATNGTELKGKVRMVAPTVDPQNRTALVYVDLLPSPANVAPAKAGMFARGEFALGSSAALTVPQQAVVLREGFNYVFVVGPDNRISQVKVQTGRRLDNQVEVLAGLKPNAAVVASGAGFLNDGDLVRVAQNATAASAPTEPASASSAKK